MKIEVVIPVWGAWLAPWRDTLLPTIRMEAADVGAKIVVYSDGPEAARIPGIEVRSLMDAVLEDGLDPADSAHAHALNLARPQDAAIAPLMGNMLPGRGTLASALRCLNAGHRAAMAINLPTPIPDATVLWASSERLSAWMAYTAGLLFWGQPSGHPGHYAWRAGNSVLVRPIYIPPALIWPTKYARPTRAMDHFLVEECLDDISQVGYLDPAEGCLAGVAIVGPHGRGPVFDHTPVRSPGEIARWMVAGNARAWNLHHMAQSFWLGHRDEATQSESDRVIEDITREFRRG